MSVGPFNTGLKWFLDSVTCFRYFRNVDNKSFWSPPPDGADRRGNEGPLQLKIGFGWRRSDCLFGMVGNYAVENCPSDKHHLYTIWKNSVTKQTFGYFLVKSDLQHFNPQVGCFYSNMGGKIYFVQKNVKI